MGIDRTVVLATITAIASSVVLAQVPASDLAKPPANARHFVIQSTGGKHGDSWSWVTADGTRMGRESMNLRGQVFELDSSGKAGPDAMPSTIAIRGVTPTGDAGETFAIDAGMARWKSPIDAGNASYSAAAFYVSQAGPIDTNAWLVETLLARPDKTMNLLPGGSARAACHSMRPVSVSPRAARVASSRNDTSCGSPGPRSSPGSPFTRGRTNGRGAPPPVSRASASRWMT